MQNSKILSAEAVATFIVMIGGPGTPIVALDVVGPGGVVSAFGLSLLVAAYTVGPISGCHINPAVTAGLALSNKMDRAKVPFYVGGQAIGAIAGGALLWALVEARVGDDPDKTGILATNQWGEGAGFGGFEAMVIVEVAFTALLIFAVLATTSKKFAPGQVGLTVGGVLALIHLATIPIDNTSVNPARSLGVALFEGGDAIEQLWAFIVFPLIGAAVGVAAWMAVDDGEGVDAPAPGV